MVSQGQECILFKSSSGEPSALLRSASGHSHLLHSAIKPSLEYSLLSPGEIWGDVLLCLGTGLGYHLKGIFQHKRKPQIIILCDLWPDLVDASAKVLEGSGAHVISVPLLDENRTTRAFGRIRKSFDELLDPRIQILRHPASYRLQREALEEFSATIFQDLMGVRADQHDGPASYALSSQGSLIPSQRTGKPHRILLLYGTHFIQKEIRHALEQNGNTVQLLDYEASVDPMRWESTLLRNMQEFFPDLILSVNLKGVDTEGVLVDTAARLGIPIHTWFVDDPRPIALAYPKRLFPQIRAFSWERAYVSWLMREGFASPTWLPLAGDPHLFSDAGKPQSPTLDLVFTGSAMGSAFLNQIRKSFLWNKNLEPEINSRAFSLLQQILSNPDQSALEPFSVLDQWNLPFQDERNKTWLSCLVQHSASHLKRKLFLEPLIPMGLICAGDPLGWKEAFGSAIQTLPDIDYRTDLRSHYQRGKIHINVTSCQMPTALNQRIFDIPLSGSFLISDPQSDLFELFGNNLVPTYHSPEELQDLVRFFSKADRDRHNVVLRLRHAILAEHTYSHRLRKILQR